MIYEMIIVFDKKKMNSMLLMSLKKWPFFCKECYLLELNWKNNKNLQYMFYSE